MRLPFRRGMATNTMATLRNARKVVCIGRNYADHIAELNSAKPKQPFFFLKPPSSIVAPGAGPVIRPKGVDLHYEVELALIIGKEVKNLKADDDQGALDAIESQFSGYYRWRLPDANHPRSPSLYYHFIPKVEFAKDGQPLEI